MISLANKLERQKTELIESIFVSVTHVALDKLSL